MPRLYWSIVFRMNCNTFCSKEDEVSLLWPWGNQTPDSCFPTCTSDPLYSIICCTCGPAPALSLWQIFIVHQAVIQLLYKSYAHLSAFCAVFFPHFLSLAAEESPQTSTFSKETQPNTHPVDLLICSSFYGLVYTP